MGGALALRFGSAQRRLFIGSVILFAANAAWIVAAILTITGPAWRIGTDVAARIASVGDLVGMGVFASAFLARGDETWGRTPRLLLGIGWMEIGWIGLSAYWRFLLPSTLGTTAQDLFIGIAGDEGLSADVLGGIPTIDEILLLWVASAVLFVAIQAAVAVAYRRAAPDDWSRGLPAYAWLLASLVSLVSTVVLAGAIASLVRGGPAGDLFAFAGVGKFVLGPNLFLSGYAASARLGWDQLRRRREFLARRVVG